MIPGDDVPLRSMEAEQLALIADNAARVQPLTLAGAAVPAAVLAIHVAPLYAVAWFALLAGLIRWRTEILKRLRDSSPLPDGAKLHRVVYVFVVTAGAQSLLMAFFPLVPVGIGAMLTMYLVGMTAGMTASTGGFPRAVTVYAGIAMGSIATAWVLTPREGFTLTDRGLFLLMSLLYIRVMRDYSKRAEQVFRDSYRIRLERVELTARLEAALREAESASRAKTRFLASASHDLRQPIHALSLFSGALTMRPLQARESAIARQIDKAVETLGSQLDALLDISRLDAGVVEQSVVELDLVEVMAQLVEEFRPQAERSGLHFDLRAPARAPVRSDAVLLRRVFSNLISNAVKYTRSGGVDVTIEPRPGSWRVAVRDTGPGIPDAERERVFEEFYQLDNPERDRTKGLGLGLAIVRRLCELLELELEMESRIGEGTVFTIDLAAAAESEEGMKQMAVDASAPTPRLHVLVVDDEEQIRLGMQTLLEEMGFGVQLASSTASALESAQGCRPSLVLADLRLRGDDSGIVAIRALRDRWPELPALLISGDTAPDRLREANSVGVELLHKPVRAAQLRETILRLATT